MRLRLLAPRYWPTWAGLGLLRLLALLPFVALLALGRGLGAVLRRVLIRFAATARRNIELCLPELTPEARARLLDEHFASLGIALLEMPLAWWSSPKRLARLVHVEGREHLEAARSRGRGVILLTAHFTTMEMAGRVLASVTPVGFLYRATRNEVLAYALSRFRSGYGSRGHPQGRHPRLHRGAEEQ